MTRLSRLTHEVQRRSLWRVLGRGAWLLVFVGCVGANAILAQSPWHNLPAGAYSVGFRMLDDQDLGRVVRGETEHPRPIRMYLWYPAAESAGPSMRFGRYAALAERDMWPRELTGDLRDRLRYSRRPLARSLGPADFQELVQQPVRAIENASALDGPFPLIVVGQGLYYESPIAQVALCEYLAGQGFVVTTAPLIGTHSPLVKLDEEDLETQVRDLEFVVAEARRLPYVSADKLGVVGFDMGGMAGVILSMRNPGVDAFVSMDSGILGDHPSGLPAISPDYDPTALRSPWLHIQQRAFYVDPVDGDYESLFDAAVHSERYLMLTDGMEHVDFTSYALVDGRKEVVGYWRASEPDHVENHERLVRYLAHFFAGFLQESPEGLVFLEEEPARVAPGTNATMEHRSSLRAPITYAEFVRELLSGDGEQAVARVRDVRETDPTNVLLDDAHLYRLAFSLFFTWQLEEEARAVIELGLALHPENEWGRPFLDFLDQRPRG